MQTLQQLKSGHLNGSKSLKLSCGLTTVPNQIRDLAGTLEVLDLSGNQLTSLPGWFAELKNLRIAFFSNNEFTEFPAILGQCSQLEMIGFKACKIKTVPEDSIPTNTRWLILTDNQIEKLPVSMGKCARMQKLMLAGNKLTELPAELAHCQNLELLRISANKLTRLPDWLFTLPRLAWLAFSGNPVSHVPANSFTLPEIPWEELELVEQLGEGASGIISKAIWRRPTSGSTSKTVAVKIFKGEVTSDGLPQDEMQAYLAAGSHPNLVQVLGKISQHPAQKLGLVMALIPAGYRNLGGPPSLESCTRDTYTPDTSFLLNEVLNISTGIASVAAHLHALGIMHADLYAHNTLVDKTGHPLFGDFGAATLYDRKDHGTAFALERLEVRAFGCLLDDLLTYLTPLDADLPVVSPLKQLRDACLQREVSQRPDFLSILSQLENCR